MIESGVFPIISLASKPIARILLSCSETATTEGSFKTTPLPGKKTKVLAVPKSIPNFLVKIPKEFYRGRYAYNKLAKEAKTLYEVLNQNLDDSIWALDRMKYLAERNGFDWTISTCLKHKKI